MADFNKEKIDRIYQSSKLLLKKNIESFNPRNYNIVFMSGSYVTDSGPENVIFERAYEASIKFNPVFILHGGDLVYKGNEENILYLKSKVELLYKNKKQIPIFVIPGDYDFDPINKTMEPFIKHISGLHFTIKINRLHFTLIALNNAITENAVNYQEYGLSEGELKYLKDNLPSPLDQDTVLIAMHIPPKDGKFAIMDTTCFSQGKEDFYYLIKNRVSAILVSHISACCKSIINNTKYILSSGTGAPLNKNEINHITLINIKDRIPTYYKIPI